MPLPQGVVPADVEALYVKESMARLTVEVAKRVWPQYWESFLGDLDTLSQYGVSDHVMCIM